MDRNGASNSRAEIAMIKYWGAKVALEVIDRSLQIHGSLGYTTDMPLEQKAKRANMVALLRYLEASEVLVLEDWVDQGSRPRKAYAPAFHDRAEIDARLNALFDAEE